MWFCFILIFKQGWMISPEDAATRLQALNRSALKSIQAQARLVCHTPNSFDVSLTPKETTSVPLSARKQQEYIKVSLLLFLKSYSQNMLVFVFKMVGFSLYRGFGALQIKRFLMTGQGQGLARS